MNHPYNTWRFCLFRDFHIKWGRGKCLSPPAELLRGRDADPVRSREMLLNRLLWAKGHG
ncbi:hypothetical protein THTE_0595 [Thermogutta terrifontis]|uniref:Uncharacterized protein n=1 Tax=Thermogutta terrifontis TaxID=1331910 RepID=A0A286RB75_9BACT|nr:hypothetical protein THTE_0595 [Thermogutta terrifontis]